MRQAGPYKILVHPPAYQDVRRTSSYLLQEALQTAEKFERAIAEAFRTICEAPYRWRQEVPGIRIFLVPDLPYKVLYRIQGERVRILRIVHQRRHPDTWRRGP